MEDASTDRMRVLMVKEHTPGASFKVQERTNKIVNKYGTTDFNIVSPVHVLICVLDISLYLTKVYMYFVFCICMSVYLYALDAS